MDNASHAGAGDAKSPHAARHRIGRFQITAPLGEGGMGLVYAAVDPMLGRPVAIKVIRRELLTDGVARQRFLREARMAGSISDPRICPGWHR